MWKCRMGRCGLFFHEACVRRLPHVKWKSDEQAEKPVFICSSHFCAGCHMSGDALHMVSCRRCVFSWHTMCVAASHQLLPPTYRDHCLCGPCREDVTDSVSAWNDKKAKAAVYNTLACTVCKSDKEDAHMVSPNRERERARGVEGSGGKGGWWWWPNNARFADTPLNTPSVAR